MFHSIKVEKTEFSSNPPLLPVYQVQPSTLPTGDPTMEAVLMSRDNKSPFEGLTYNPETMSLRAKINLGLPLQKVSMGVTENDPAILQRKIIEFAQAVDYRVSSRLASSDSVDTVATVLNSSVQPSDS